jgi:hypothetical protein
MNKTASIAAWNVSRFIYAILVASIVLIQARGMPTAAELPAAQMADLGRADEMMAAGCTDIEHQLRVYARKVSVTFDGRATR